MVDSLLCCYALLQIWMVACTCRLSAHSSDFQWNGDIRFHSCILDSPKPAFYTKPSSQQKVKLSAVNGHNMQRDFLVIKVDKHFNANTREYVLSSAWIQHSGVITTKHQHTTDSLWKLTKPYLKSRQTR